MKNTNLFIAILSIFLVLDYGLISVSIANPALLKPEEAIILQTRSYSCGAAALATLLNYFYKIPVTETEILEIATQFMARRNKDISQQGLDALSLKEVLLEYQIKAQAIQTDEVSFTHYFQANGLPLIAQLTIPQNHYVVIVGWIEEKFLVADPWLGYQWLTLEELSYTRGFTGVILVPQIAEDTIERASEYQRIVLDEMGL